MIEFVMTDCHNVRRSEKSMDHRAFWLFNIQYRAHTSLVITL